MPLGQNVQIITGPWTAIYPYGNDTCANRHSLRGRGIAKQTIKIHMMRKSME